MCHPLISVIVPVYKTEKYLRKCLDSICGQTYRNLEIICVDDESPDRSGEILEEYARRDPRIKVIHRKNGGLSAARNSGLAAATGEWIAAVDSDDWLETDIYEKAVDKLTDGVDILVFGTRIVYEPGVEQDDGFERYFNLPEEGTLRPDDVRRARINVCFWNKLWRRSFISEKGVLFPDGLIHEDEYFYRCLALHARIVYVLPHVGYNYVQRRHSIIHSDKTALQRYQDRLRIVDMIISFHVSNGTVNQAKEYILPYWVRCLHTEDEYGSWDFTAQALQLNRSVIMKHHLDETYGNDCLRRLLPFPRWKRLFVKHHSRGTTYRFFGIHLFTVVYENNCPVGWESSWLKLPRRLLGGKG